LRPKAGKEQWEGGVMKCKDGVDIQIGLPCPICGAEPNQECRTRTYGLWLAERERQAVADAEKKAAEQMNRMQHEAEHDRRVAE
jgi:hypothetical protein